MKILETIDLRISTSHMESTEERILILVNDDTHSDEIRINCYRNYDIETDYTIQLFHKNKNIGKTGSETARKIIFNLKSFGLVNHNIWRKL